MKWTHISFSIFSLTYFESSDCVRLFHYEISKLHLIALKKMFSTKFDENRKLWYGGDIPVEHESKISLGQALLNSMRVFGSKVGQVKY